MKNIKTIISLVLVMAMMASVALANDSKIIITSQNGESGADFLPGIDKNGGYTETDLFVNFKNMMPGDTLTEQVTITNKWSSWQYIDLSMDMILHENELLGTTENVNGISASVWNELTADERKEQSTNLEYMMDFLNKLELTIKENGAELYRGPAGAAAEDFLVKTLSYNSSIELDLTLKMPIELGNEYANRVGEVDWVFTYSGWDDEEPTTAKPTTAPTSSSTDPTGSTSPTEPTEEITDPSIPLNPVDPDDPSSPDTGDHSNMLPYIVMFIIGLMGLILTSKKRKTN